jgi:hypothetical protein
MAEIWLPFWLAALAASQKSTARKQHEWLMAEGIHFVIEFHRIPSGKLTVTMGNHHFQWENPLINGHVQ